MQIVELKIEDDYIDSVLNILKSLKSNMIKEINIINSDGSKTVVTKDSVINTTK